MNWRQEIRAWWKNPAVLLCLALIIAPIIIIALLSGVDPYTQMTINILRIIAGAGGGGLLTITVINAGTRKRSSHAYKGIIGHLCVLSMNIHANFEYRRIKSSVNDKIIFNLSLGGFGDIDVSNDIENIASRLHNQASSMSDEDYYSVPYQQKIIYDVKDLVSIYFRDAIYNANDEKELEQLDSATRWGLKFIGSVEGWGKPPADSLSKDQLYLLCFFLDACLPLYRLILNKRGVPVIMNDSRIKREWQKPHA